MKCMFGEAAEKELVKKELAGADRIGELRLGKELLLHRYFFRTRYIRYTDISRVFQRMESGESGDFSVSEHSLVVVDRAGTEHVLHVDYKQYAAEGISRLTERYPHISVGKEGR